MMTSSRCGKKHTEYGRVLITGWLWAGKEEHTTGALQLLGLDWPQLLQLLLLRGNAHLEQTRVKQVSDQAKEEHTTGACNKGIHKSG